jgi:hypothetical protein
MFCTVINLINNENVLIKEWNKHWFVLRGSALLFYRDPTAEDQGILDGVVDLSCVTTVSEVQVNRNYGFQTIVSIKYKKNVYV